MTIQFSMVVPCWSRTPDGVDTSVLQVTRISTELSIFGAKVDFKWYYSCLQNVHPVLNGGTLLVKDAWWYQHLRVSNKP
jgi:hypothetical protein